MENEALRQYLAYADSDDDFLYQLRMEYEWDDAAYLHMLKLLTNVLEAYRESPVIPKAVVWFLTTEVNLIVGLVSNDLFHINPPAPFTNETYRALIDTRVSELLQLQKALFAGAI